MKNLHEEIPASGIFTSIDPYYFREYSNSDDSSTDSSLETGENTLQESLATVYYSQLLICPMRRLKSVVQKLMKKMKIYYQKIILVILAILIS